MSRPVLPNVVDILWENVIKIIRYTVTKERLDSLTPDSRSSIFIRHQNDLAIRLSGESSCEIKIILFLGPDIQTKVVYRAELL